MTSPSPMDELIALMDAYPSDPMLLAMFIAANSVGVLVKEEKA